MWSGVLYGRTVCKSGFGTPSTVPDQMRLDTDGTVPGARGAVKSEAEFGVLSVDDVYNWPVHLRYISVHPRLYLLFTGPDAVLTRTRGISVSERYTVHPPYPPPVIHSHTSARERGGCTDCTHATLDRTPGL